MMLRKSGNVRVREVIVGKAVNDDDMRAKAIDQKS